MDNGRLMLTRYANQSVEVFTDAEHLKLTVTAVGLSHITCRLGDGKWVDLVAGGAPFDLGLGMTLQLKDCTKGQCKLAFHGPRSVTVLRSELRPRQ